MDQDGRLAANAHALRLQQRQRKASRDTRVNGVAASFEQVQADRRGQVVAGGNHTEGALQHGAGGERNRSAFAHRRAVSVQISTEGALRGVGHLYE